MTKCNRSEVNLKSTVYNQNGQSYIEQLAAYNSMNSHLRRVLMAKCVVDAKNKNYMRKRKRFCKQPDCKPRIVKKGTRNNIIDILAYDTLHHPADLLRMSYDSKYLCQGEDQKYFADCYDYDVICSQSRLQNRVLYPGSPKFDDNKSESFIPNDRPLDQRATKTALKFQNTYDEDPMLYETATDFLTQEINHLSMTVSSSRSYDKFKTAQGRTDVTCNQETCVKDDEEKYAKFVYEITCEIINDGLYTDEQLRDVFKKHLDKNRSFLSMNKMLYEICQLKLSLNISDDSDDEELDDLVHAQQLFRVSKIRPPTPPKVLNENKVVEKLMYYEQQKDLHKSNNRNKSVVLIDVNPEIVVTERDVLSSLIESDINPAQAQKIYKRLSALSKDETSIDLIQARPEQSNDDDTAGKSNRLKFSLKELNDVHEENKQEQSSATSDIIMLEHKEAQS
ncbi:uncharacterized protein LOC122399134 isoform X1 [Colletes gigas]|uniref:uncharacterized protein LOC122399134 isoform X1 n=1 Tax=Colletes gigas TaxID=935657 RepID=UPI001C9A850C|nr:uncharacterized protein LOC122399134 isoform X1 [Colletes gigas]